MLKRIKFIDFYSYTITTTCVDVAVGPPLRIILIPVYTVAVDVPWLLVTVNDVVYVPVLEYVY